MKGFSMTDDDLTMKIRTHSGGEIEIPAKACDRCDGTGILGQPARAEWISADDPTQKRIVEAKAGDRCPFCNGRGMVGVAGGPPRQVRPKPSEIN